MVQGSWVCPLNCRELCFDYDSLVALAVEDRRTRSSDVFDLCGMGFSVGQCSHERCGEIGVDQAAQRGAGLEG